MEIRNELNAVSFGGAITQLIHKDSDYKFPPTLTFPIEEKLNGMDSDLFTSFQHKYF